MIISQLYSFYHIKLLFPQGLYNEYQFIFIIMISNIDNYLMKQLDFKLAKKKKEALRHSQ